MSRAMAWAAGSVLALTFLPGAVAEPGGRPTPSAAEVAASITELDLGITDLDRRIEELDRSTTDGAETVISLTSDVLFDFGKAELPTSAPAKLEEILAGIPDGTAIKVEGHTDSIGDDADNQDLSERRAKAVADAIAQVRPELVLEVRGFGESRPVADNTIGGEDNPHGRALNRRVEIRYAD